MEESKMPEQRGGNKGNFPGGDRDRTPGSGKKGENMGGGSIKKDQERPMEPGRKPTQNPNRP
jgi:general stress protein YciG